MKRVRINFFVAFLALVATSCAHHSNQRSIQNPNDDQLARESKDRFSEERLIALQKQIPESKIEGAAIDCRLGDSEKGQSTLRTIYKENEAKSSYWLALGNCSVQNMDFDRAYFFFKIALSKAKDKREEARVLNNLGVLLWKKNNHKDAISHFVEAKKRGTLLAPIFNLCSLYVEHGQWELAKGIIVQAPKELALDSEWKMLTSIVKGQ